MIELRTGVPGSGKTLSMVEELSKLFVRWGKHPEEARPVFVHNIKNLALPHAAMPVQEITAGARKQLVPDWDAMPDGSLVLIDECQDVFPPRSSQSVAPPHVAWLNTHRHKGFDIWLTTQQPKLIDFAVRALVGKHQYFRRLFGGQRSAVYEWDACSDNHSGLKEAVTTIYGFPKHAYKFYKSAEIHTKQKFKLPRWLLIPLAGLVLSAFAVPRAYNTLKGAIGGKGIAVQAATAQTGSNAGNAAIAPIASAASAPVLSDSSSGALSRGEPVFAGCIAAGQRCSCFDTSGKRYDQDGDMCEVLASAPVLPAEALPEPRTDRSTSSEDLEVYQFLAKQKGPRS